MYPFQTESQLNGIRKFHTLKEAIAWGDRDRTVWKISFEAHGEYVRLCYNHFREWVYAPVPMLG